MVKISGTREWAVKNVNCLVGCSHNCLYCYGKAMARRFGRVTSDSEWATPVLCAEQVNEERHLAGGPVMFPATHDIVPEFLGPCMTVLGNLLAAGNRVLIVSKPHLVCIKRICREFADYKRQILFRFTIGAYDARILGFWEPGAPTYHERLVCLRYAFDHGFRTSVSVEPMLDAPNAVELFHRLSPYVTDSIWLGKLNRARNCVGKNRIPEVEAAIRWIEANQTDKKIRAIYKVLKHERKVRWKESIKKVVGLKLASVAGKDR